MSFHNPRIPDSQKLFYIQHMLLRRCIQNGNICIQHRMFAVCVPACPVPNCTDLDLYVFRVYFHIFRYHFRDIGLDKLHHFRRAVDPVRDQQDFQSVFGNLTGAFSAKEMPHFTLLLMPYGKYLLPLSRKKYSSQNS